MALHAKPNDDLEQTALPAPLRKAIHAVFASKIEGCVLVGGTALAGYYANHRRSDDMDLFTSDAISQAMAVSAVKNLTSIGAKFYDERNSATYFHALIELDGHRFTADVVLDTHLHKVGRFEMTKHGVVVADLLTLLKMKIAALVSRCSEKDLFDLYWLFKNYRKPSIDEALELGREIDQGISAEALLIGLCGANLRESACSFAMNHGTSSTEVYSLISEIKKSMLVGLVQHLQDQKVETHIAALIRKLKRLV
jgi:hypothetical protein